MAGLITNEGGMLGQQEVHSDGCLTAYVHIDRQSRDMTDQCGGFLFVLFCFVLFVSAQAYKHVRAHVDTHIYAHARAHAQCS